MRINYLEVEHEGEFFVLHVEMNYLSFELESMRLPGTDDNILPVFEKNLSPFLTSVKKAIIKSREYKEFLRDLKDDKILMEECQQKGITL